jgi:hypothetical protein
VPLSEAPRETGEPQRENLSSYSKFTLKKLVASFCSGKPITQSLLYVVSSSVKFPNEQLEATLDWQTITRYNLMTYQKNLDKAG